VTAAPVGGRSAHATADADGYGRAMGRWSLRRAEPLLDRGGAADGERALDAGCGTGLLAFAAAARCAPRRLPGVGVCAH